MRHSPTGYGLPSAPGMVHEVVHVAAEQVFGLLITQELDAGGIAEDAIAFEIDPINRLGRGVEQQLELFLEA